MVEHPPGLGRPVSDVPALGHRFCAPLNATTLFLLIAIVGLVIAEKARGPRHDNEHVG